MSTTYTETPHNMNEIASFVETEINSIKNAFFMSERIVFYDACSFQRHSHLPDSEKSVLVSYYKAHGTVIFITRCILMELAADGHKLKEEYISFIKKMAAEEIKIVLFNEEYVYDILSECYSTNEKINEYLTWAVRMVKSPVSTITETLKKEEKLTAEVVEGKNLRQSDIYRRFFSAVRDNKEHADNLGEELIAVCVHILSYLPGLANGKICVITDDKGAASKIHSVLKRTNADHRGAGIILFSTPKLVQHMFQEQIKISKDEMVNILSQGISGNIVVMGTTACDFDVNVNISLTSEALVGKIMEPNGINIIF